MRATAAERRMIRTEVANASIERLAYYLSPWPEWAALDGYEGWIPCPRCQRSYRAPFRSGPSAVVDHLGLGWSCANCRAQGTRFGIEWQVLNDPSAVALVLADVLAAGIRR